MKRKGKDYFNILKAYLKKILDIAGLQEMRILPGHLAFFFVLSTIPMITIIGLVCGMFHISAFDIVNFLDSIIPHAVMELLTPFMEIPPTDITGWFLILGFVLASNGAYSIILASNALYKIENDPYLLGRIKALFLTIILMVLFLFVVVFLAFGNSILKFVLGFEMFVSVADTIYAMFLYLKWPLAFIIVFLLVKMIYTIAPGKRISSKYVNKGAFFTTIGWIIATAIYSYYADNLANYNLFYGSLSNIIILMMWIYFIAYIFVIGIAINSSIYHVEHPEKISNYKEEESGESKL